MEINKIHISESFNGRLDPLQFHPERMDMIHQIYSSGKWCKLKDVVNNVKTTTSSLTNDDIYIGLENITSNTGEYVATSDKDTISSAAVFSAGDILFPKLRPYLNKVHRAKFNGKCSTEFHVFAAKNMDAEFLTIILRSNLIVAQTKHLMTGNTLPRLQTSDIENLIIPSPSALVQQDVVSFYTKIQEEKRIKEQDAQSLLKGIDSYILDELGVTLPATPHRQLAFNVNLSEMLGNRYDPYYHQRYFKDAFNALNNSNYPTCCLGKIALKITSGITPLSGGDAYTNSNDGIPFIRSGNIDINGNLNFNELLYLKPYIHEIKMKSSQVQNGDLMIAIVGATIGQVGIYTDSREANINQAIALVRLNAGVNKQFIKEQIKSGIGQLNLNRLKRPVARANINLEEISTMKLIIPPLAKQNEIAETISRIRGKVSAMQAEALAQLTAAKQQIERIILG